MQQPFTVNTSCAGFRRLDLSTPFLVSRITPVFFETEKKAGQSMTINDVQNLINSDTFRELALLFDAFERIPNEDD